MAVLRIAYTKDGHCVRETVREMKSEREREEKNGKKAEKQP